MRKDWIITIIIILLLIAFFYFFNPACKFHRVGTTFEGQNSYETCYCKFIGSYCERASIGTSQELTDEQIQELEYLFSGE